MIVITLKRMGFGFILYMPLCSIISTLIGGDNIVPPDLVERIGSFQIAYLLQMLLSGILGVVSIGGVGFYDIERWSLLKAAVTHFALIITVFIPVSLILCWVKSTEGMLIMFIIMTLAYTIIFLIMWIIYKMDVRELNNIQQEFVGNNLKQ